MLNKEQRNQTLAVLHSKFTALKVQLSSQLEAKARHLHCMRKYNRTQQARFGLPASSGPVRVSTCQSAQL